MTSRTLITLVLAHAAAAAPLLGQNAHLAQSQPEKYQPPLCPIKPLNKNVEKAVDALRKSYGAKPEEKPGLLNQAQQNLVTAITQEAQGKNAAAWYYLARVALLKGDARGADSAFTQAEALQPSCEIDINQYRQNSWAAVANAGLELQRTGNVDSALALFREANYLFRKMPHVYSNMGVLFANADQTDSAIVYFAKALEVAQTDSTMVEDRNGSALNLAVMYGRAGKHQEAIKTLHQYLQWAPNDNEARKALAASFRGAGMEDSAAALETKMVEEFSKSNLDSLDLQDVMAVGVLAFNAQRYEEAENAFRKALERNPWSRDARYNLANAYFAQKKHAELIAEAQKLIEIEPLSEDVLRLLAQGQRGLKQDEAVLTTATRLVGLPFTIDVTGFQMGESRAKFVGEAVGRDPMDAAGNKLKTAPVTIAMEFIDLKGTVIATKELTIPVLKPEEKHAIELEGAGAGIAGWRYRVK